MTGELISPIPVAAPVHSPCLRAAPVPHFPRPHDPEFQICRARGWRDEPPPVALLQFRELPPPRWLMKADRPHGHGRTGMPRAARGRSAAGRGGGWPHAAGHGCANCRRFGRDGGRPPFAGWAGGSPLRFEKREMHAAQPAVTMLRLHAPCSTVGRRRPAACRAVVCDDELDENEGQRGRYYGGIWT